MQNNIIRSLLLALFLIVSSCKTTGPIAIDGSHDHEESTLTVGKSAAYKQVKADITFLASDELEGRETGTEGERKAADYIAGRFKGIGLSGFFGGDEPYFQYFKKTIRSNPHADAPNPNDPVIMGKNVAAFIDNGQAYTVIIGAHYDHLGYGAEGSLHTGAPAIHNGADDNASGVAAMLHLAEAFKTMDLSNNVLFIAFSGEEKGLWGSNFFVDNSPLTMDDVNYMINMDMVGRLNEDRQLAVYGTGTSPSWKKLMTRVKSPVFKMKMTESGLGPSDHSSFYLEDIPVLHFFTGQHEDYHRPSDDTHKINFDGIMDITRYISSIVQGSDGYGKLTFTKTKDEQSSVPKWKVTLGVIPDYLYDGKGMRIDGVRDGKTASVAGIKKGDVVVKMGDLEIVDMMTYMKALSAFEPGQRVEVTVVREGDMMMVKEVVFQ